MALPDVPTMIEAGFPDIAVEAWWGLFVPAGTPAPIVDKNSRGDREGARPAGNQGLSVQDRNDPLPGPPDLLRQLLARDLAKWGDYVRLAKIEPQ